MKKLNMKKSPKTIFSYLHFLLFPFFVFFLFAGCEKTISNEPKKIHWDRDMCIRCKMVLSDRKFSAQTQDPTTGKQYHFDDIGCVILWFKEDEIKWGEQAKIWVNDVKTGEWIDAREAKYTTDHISPMGYGFGAHLLGSEPKGKELVDFNEMSKRVLIIGK